MIRYRLRCANGHEFEAWFGSSAAYEAQEASGHLACPACGDAHVGRAIMAPSVATGTRQSSDNAEPAAASSQPPESSQPPQGHAIPAELRTALREARALRDEILSKSEYVGPRFADEARRIHFEEAPDRPIHGEADPEEVKSLHEDGIAVMPIPLLPDDLN
ncbi:MAG: DUF1178 family protein [Hyphomicrobiaceae bacterium]|nr:DUF1178 family protein [Hyphomicrobiaceae bacterium]